MADLRNLPKVDALAASPDLAGFTSVVRAQAAREAVATLRDGLKSGNGKPLPDAITLALAAANRLAQPTLKRVLNATGVVLHTGLGRARLAEAAARRLFEVASAHSATEIDMETGQRGDRQAHVRGHLVQLSGAEDAYVVNNGAAAILLALAALCRGREVILSRGEMVEIGGAFRMPEVIEESGCRLVEVGCTNKTRISDYEDVVTEDTAAILRCHPSNYRVVGFAESPSDREIAELAKRRGILFLYDLGNGCFWDTAQFGLPRETTVQEAVDCGPDLVTASGDKLLGGPQAGLILGKASALKALKKHPLARALRVDKLTMAALECTLQLHFEERLNEIPTFRYLNRPLTDVRRDAQRLARAFRGPTVVELGESEVGGGSVPGVAIPTWRTGFKSRDPETLARRLRTGEPAILGRTERGIFWLDPRTLEPSEVKEAASRLSVLELV